VFGLTAGERPGVLALVGVAVALLAIALVSASAGAPDPGTGVVRGSGLPQAVLAGAGFGAFFICLEAAGASAGLWPLVGARVSSLSLAGLLLIVTGSPLRPAAGTARALAAAGALDVSANVLYLLAARRGLLSLVAVLTSMYPASTVVLARMVLRERLTPARVAGLGTALVGVALIALG
jgi:drug/metabolite transporter (DMT)-like permease